RDLAQTLAPFRDAQSAIEAFDAFRKRYRTELAGEPLANIRERLVEVKSETDPGDDELSARLAQTLEHLREFRARAQAWPIRREGFDAVAGGLHALYQAGGEEMAAAYRAAKREPFAMTT